MEFYFQDVDLALNQAISAGEERCVLQKADVFAEFLCWVAAFSAGGRQRREFPPPSHLDGCMLESRKLRGVRNDGVMLTALINEFLDVLLQPFKALLSCSHLSPLPGQPPRGKAHREAVPHVGTGAPCSSPAQPSEGEGEVQRRAVVHTHPVLLPRFMGSKLLWGGSHHSSCCRDLLRERVKTLTRNTMSPEAVTLLVLLLSSLRR